MRSNVIPLPTEGQDQAALMQWLGYNLKPGVVHWSTPNEATYKNGKLRKQGVQAGIPDIFLFHAGQLYALEMKRRKGGRISHEQAEMHWQLATQGAAVAVCNGFEEAVKQVEAWGLCK